MKHPSFSCFPPLPFCYYYYYYCHYYSFYYYLCYYYSYCFVDFDDCDCCFDVSHYTVLYFVLTEYEKVYTDKKNCLAALKKFRGSRFKSFNTYEEALHFAENGPVTVLPQHIPGSEENKVACLNIEKPSPYRGPKSQDLVKFRKAIEKEDENYFNQVWLLLEFCLECI